MTKLPEVIQKQVGAKITEIIAGEVEKIAIMVFEMGHRAGAAALKARIEKHCAERVAWLESQRAARPEEGWGIKKSEVEHLALELKAFSEEPQG